MRSANASVLVGDVNGDQTVNMEDLVIAAHAFGSYPGHPRWNSPADVNSDGKVDMKDLCIIAKHFGKTTDATVITATVNICPHSLSLHCKGKWITAFIELPEEYSPLDINVSTILLNATIPAESKPVCIWDHDCDGILALMVKFDRQQVIDLILKNCQFTGKFGKATLTITGELESVTFQGSDTIKIILCKP
jgi:hypothetical protein